MWKHFLYLKPSLQASWNNCEGNFSFFWAPCVEICPKRYLTHLIVWVHLLGRFSKGLWMYSIYKRDFQKCKHLFLPQGCPCQESGTTLRCPCTHLFWERKSWRIQIRNPKNKRVLTCPQVPQASPSHCGEPWWWGWGLQEYIPPKTFSKKLYIGYFLAVSPHL